MGRQTWLQFEEGFRCWSWNLLTAGLGFSLRWKICQKTAMEVVDFCGGFFGRKIQKENPPKKSAGKSASRKPKIRRRTTPPKSASQTQKTAAKPTNKSACQTSKCTSGFFDWEGLLLEASSEHGFWDTFWLPSGHGQGSHVEMHLQSLSCCWWDGQSLLRTLPDNTLSQKRSFWENSPKITTKIRHATLPPLAAQCVRGSCSWSFLICL